MYPSQLLLESLHIQGCLYIIMLFMCLCVPLLESLHIQGCLYNMCVMCCLRVCVYPSELLLHIQGCLYIIMYMCVMCILSVYVFVPSQLLLESLHTWVYVPE